MPYSWIFWHCSLWEIYMKLGIFPSSNHLFNLKNIHHFEALVTRLFRIFILLWKKMLLRMAMGIIYSVCMLNSSYRTTVNARSTSNWFCKTLFNFCCVGLQVGGIQISRPLLKLKCCRSLIMFLLIQHKYSYTYILHLLMRRILFFLSSIYRLAKNFKLKLDPIIG